MKLDIAGFERYNELNPDIDILTFDFLHPDNKGRVNWDGSDKEATVEKLMRYQRLLRVIPEPALASVLYARHIPPNGGDTLWLSACAAHDGLSPPLQEFLAGLHAEHDFLQAYGSYFQGKEDGAERIRRAREETPPVVHPLIVVHPVSGRRVLYVNPTFTSRIVELSRSESAALLAMSFRGTTPGTEVSRCRSTCCFPTTSTPG